MASIDKCVKLKVKVKCKVKRKYTERSIILSQKPLTFKINVNKKNLIW